MKKIILTLGIICGLTGFSLAQTAQNHPNVPPPPPHHMTAEQRAQMRTDALGHMLTLTDDQKKAMYNVNLDMAKKVEAARQNKDRNAMQQIMQETDAQYKKILTTKQYAQYQQALTAKRTTPAPHQHN
jgi:Spy/CpxP family protein refolding chaperone